MTYRLLRNDFVEGAIHLSVYAVAVKNDVFAGKGFAIRVGKLFECG